METLIILLILILFIIAIFNFIKTKNVFNPSTFQCTMWIFAFGCFLIDRKRIGQLELKTVLIISAGIIFYQFPTVILLNKVKSIKVKSIKVKSIKVKSIKVKSIKVINYFLLLLLPLLFIKIINIIKTSPFSGFFLAKLRWSFIYGRVSLGIFSYISMFVFCYTIYLYIELKEKEINKKYFLQALIILIIFAIISTGRTKLMDLMLSIIIVDSFYIDDKKYFYKKLCIIIVSIFFIFIFLGVLMGKIDNIFKSLINYTAVSIKGLDLYLENNFLEPDYGVRLFRSIYIFFNKLGFQYENVSIIQEYIKTKNITTNVYTIFKPYIQAFGEIFCYLMMFIIGIINSIVYNKAIKERKKIYIYIYIFLAQAIFYQISDERIITLLSGWIQQLIYGIIFFKSKLFVQNVKRRK